MLWSEVWYGDDLRSRVIRGSLLPASWLYTLGWNTYLLSYRIGLKRAKSPHHPVICVGNLTVGGSGKSPTTIHIAEKLRALGSEVTISCSGYGSPASEEATLAPKGELDPHRWGDEPAMVRWLLPEVPLIVGRNRVRAAALCHSHFPDSILLMDDGFQHLPLRKDITVLLDPPTPNHACLPAGPYREPQSHRRRADLVLPGSFEAVSNGLRFQRPDGTPTQMPVSAAVLCALGRPDNFLGELKRCGIGLGTVLLKPDHDPLSAGNLFDEIASGEPLVVTAKDWVKLRTRADIGSVNVLIARQQLRIEPEKEFAAWLRQRLNEVEQKA